MAQIYNGQIYKLYEKEVEKNNRLSQKYEKLRWEVEELRYENKVLQKKVDEVDTLIEKAVDKAVAKVTKIFEEKIEILQKDNEEKAREIDRLRNQINKNSTNSSKPSSTDFATPKKEKRTSANEYNYRTSSKKTSGGQLGHEGHSLSKEKLEEVIKNKKVEVIEFIHDINGNEQEEDLVKYKVGIKLIPFIEKHIFKHSVKSKETLPKEFYTDVTYDSSLKSLVVELGSYNLIPYNRVTDLISIFSNGVINLSEGTIQNFYNEFSKKSASSLENIENNVLNESSMNTDETSSKCNKKSVYFRGYSNKLNVLYKAHSHKGHIPIKEDNILPRYHGCIVGDHDTTLYKYGIMNQECNIHAGRYLIEINENSYETYWQQEMLDFLFTINRTRKLAIKFGKSSFEVQEIQWYEKTYDKILEKALIENQNIASSYYRDKAEKLRRRLIKYKDNHLYFLKDFSVPFDNNAMERDLRMIKGKTKISGGFRSIEGAKLFADAMSIIKTSIKRKINPMQSIKDIFENKVLFGI